jgi:hypothetical protein
MMTTTTTAISTQFAVVMPKEYAFDKTDAVLDHPLPVIT